MDVGPVSLVYYTLCAAPGAAAGLLQASCSRCGAGKALIVTCAGALGGMGGGAMVATAPTPPPGKGSDILVIAGTLLLSALCGWLVALVAARLLRRGSS
jgi:hypothetical protein